MSIRYITEEPDGNVLITQMIGDDATGERLTRSLFELSRTSDLTTPFDSAVHSRSQIARGLPGHRPLVLLGSCEQEALPADRYFRNAWKWSDDEITVDMSKARDIHMAAIRSVRDQRLKDLDIAMLRAIEAQDVEAQTSVADEKQTLRDIPQTFDLSQARTAASLKGLWPSHLA